MRTKPDRYPEMKPRIVQYLRASSQARRRQPKMREIAEFCNCSVGAVHKYMHRMAEEGIIEPVTQGRIKGQGKWRLVGHEVTASGTATTIRTVVDGREVVRVCTVPF